MLLVTLTFGNNSEAQIKEFLKVVLIATFGTIWLKKSVQIFSLVGSGLKVLVSGVTLGDRTASMPILLPELP